MADHVIYLDRFRLREGVMDDFRKYCTEMAEFVEDNVPGVVSFNYYVEQDRPEGVAVFVFSDAEALDRHLDKASSRFQEGADLLAAADIELLGPASDRATELTRSFGGNTTKVKVAGFGR